MNLTVIIPVFNEVKTINEIINKILKVNINYKEVIIVDDHSNDGTKEKLKKFEDNKLFKIFYHDKNMGKGSCIISAIPFITGEYVIIQDADLEYDPQEYKKFFDIVALNRDIEVIYGSRVLGRKKFEKKFMTLFRIFANYILTFISNILNNQKLTDVHTCYKFMKSQILKDLNLSHKDFSICPEITTKLSHLKKKIIEIPISYNGRSYSEGKKIKFKDAIIAFYTLIKFKFFWK